MENTTPTQVEKAIQVMYGSSPTSPTSVSPQAQNAAIQWLSVFNESSISWYIYPQLLRSTYSSVRFYAANGLYSKIRSNWHILDQEQRNHIEDELWATLDTITETDKPVLSRIVLALSTVSLLSAKEGHVDNFIQRIITTVQELLEQEEDDHNPIPSSTSHSSSTSSHIASSSVRISAKLTRNIMLQLCISLLKELEILYKDLQKSLTDETRNAAKISIINATPTVLDLCGALLSDNLSPFGVSKAAETASTVDDPNNISGKPAIILQGTETALACAAGWVYYLEINRTDNEQTNAIPRIVYIAQHHMPILQSSVEALTTVPHGVIANSAVEFLQIAFQPSEIASSLQYDNDGDEAGDSLVGGFKLPIAPTEESDEVLTELIKTLVSSAPYLQNCIEACRWSVAGAYGRLLASLAENEAAWITGRGASLPLPDDISVSHFPYVGAAVDPDSDGSTIGGEPIGLGVLVGDLALQCAAIPDLRSAEGVLQGFQYIAYLDMESRHPFFQHILYRQLAIIIVSQCIDARSTFPSPADDEIPNLDDNEELQRYRWEYPENWKEYRRSYSTDALSDCVNALGSDILPLLSGLLEPETSETLQQIPLPSHITKVSLDTRLEGLFNCLSYMGKDILERMEDEDTLDGSAGEYLASLFMFGVGRSAKELHPSLGVTICRFIDAYRSWLHSLSNQQPVRYSMDGPFHSLSISGEGNTTTNSTSPIATSIGFLPSQELFESIFGFLISGLECVNIRSGFTSASQLVTGRTSIAALKLLTGKQSESRKHASSSPDGLDDGDDFEQTDVSMLKLSNTGEQSTSFSANNMAVADAAAYTLHRLVLSCGTQIPVDDVIQGLVSACDASVDGGLPIQAEALIISACINLCSYLPIEILPGHLEAILDRPLRILQRTYARIRNKKVGLSKFEEASAMCALAIMEQVLRPAPAEDSQIDDNLSSSSSSGITIHAGYLQFVGEKLWQPEIDTLLSITRQKPECVGIIFAFMSQTLRCFPSYANENRLQGIMEAAVEVYETTLHSGALTLLQEAIAVLVKANVDELSPEVPINIPSSIANIFTDLMRVLVDTTLSAALQNQSNLPSLNKNPESCSGLYSLSFDILRLCPDIIADEQIGPILLQLLPHVFAVGETSATVAAIRFFERLFLYIHMKYHW